MTVLRRIWLLFTRPLACRRQLLVADMPDGSTAICIDGKWTIVSGDYGGLA